MIAEYSNVDNKLTTNIMKTITKGDASFDILQAQKVSNDFKKVLKKTLQVL